ARNTRSAISPRLATSTRRIAIEFMRRRIRQLCAERFTVPEMKLRLLAVIAVLAAATAGSARAATTLIVTGHGWGHGVGMSQWGAYGYARHGWNYKRILSHYYPGTKIGRTGEANVRVLLARGAKTVTVGCATPMRVTDGRRLTRKLAAG